MTTFRSVCADLPQVNTENAYNYYKPNMHRQNDAVALG